MKLHHYKTSLSTILDAFGATNDEKRPDGWRARCPIHEGDDRVSISSPSLILDVFERENGSHYVRIHCQSQSCTASNEGYNEALTRVGLTRRQLENISYVGQAKRGRRTAAPLASSEQRETLEARAFRAAHKLDKLLREGHEIVELLREQYGVEQLNPFELGLGWESSVDRETGELREYLVVFTSTLDQRIAWLQRREVRDGKLIGDWLSAANPDKGTEDEARFDGAGIVGNWRGSGLVLVAEGASDSIALAALDAYDVIGVRGAVFGSKIDDRNDALIGRDVVVLADNDDAGEKMTREVAAKLEPIANSVSWVRWRNEIDGYDVRDFRAESPASFKKRLDKLVTKAERIWREDAADGFDAKAYLGSTNADAADAVRDYLRSLGYDVAFTPELGWLFFDRTVWQTNAERIVVHMVTRLGKKLRAIGFDELRKANAKAANEEEIDGEISARTQREQREARAVIKFAESRFLSTGQIKATLDVLAAHPSVAATSADFDADPDVLAVANGVVELRTGKLREMRASDRITRRLDVAYRPDATAPRFEQFLREVFVDDEQRADEELIAYVRRLIGYAVTGHSSEQKFWLLYSPVGANGKSQFLDILRFTFDAFTRDTSFSLFERTGFARSAGDESRLAQMREARIVVASEGSGRALDEGLVKQITGEDAISAKFMRGNSFSFEAKFTLFLATNNMPRFSNDQPMWRRVRVIEFKRTFRESEQVKGIGRSIAEAEAEGILALAVAEAAKWHDEGLPKCSAIDDSTEHERREADVLREFITYNVHDGETPNDGAVLLMDLWARYLKWTQALGIDVYSNEDENWPTSDRQLREYLTKQWGRPANFKHRDPKTGEWKRSNSKPVHWRGRRLIAPHVVNDKFNRERMDVLGVEGFANAGYRELDLGVDEGAERQRGKLSGVEPIDPTH